MKTLDVRNVLKFLVAAACRDCSVSVHNPNVNTDASLLDRVEVQVVATNQTGGTLKGNEIFRETGTLMVIATSPFGGGEGAAMETAEEVVSVFREGRYFKVVATSDIPSDLADWQDLELSNVFNLGADVTGWIVVKSAPSIRAGYRDESVYRVPIAVQYVATALAKSGQVRG